MAKDVYLYSYNQHSQGAKELTLELGIKRLRKDNSKFVGAPHKTVINWGCQNLPEFVTKGGSRILNPSAVLAQSSNKLTCMKFLRNHPTPPRIPAWTTSLEEVHSWLREGFHVFARKILNGSSGNGIEIMSPEHPDTWNVIAPLYTKYIKKKEEFRVHCINKRDPRAFLVQRKGISKEFAKDNDVNPMIRNLSNGYVFVRNDITVPEDVIRQARATFLASGLDFAAIDVIYQEKSDKAYVLEINTAPGLQGSTIKDYAEALRGIL